MVVEAQQRARLQRRQDRTVSQHGNDPHVESVAFHAFQLVPQCDCHRPIWLLAVVVRQMSVSVAYAVWSGLGTAAIAAVGVLAMGERMDAVKLTALALIIVGVVVLNVHTAH